MEETSQKICLTSLKIDGHSIEIPVGLSELLETTWISERTEPIYTNEYDRNVVKKNGNFVTLLTKRRIK